jgi:hypothetical protein
VRRDQEWFHQAKSVSLVLKGKVTDAKGKEMGQVVEAHFDRSRLRHRVAREGGPEEIRVWDGKRAVICVRGPRPGDQRVTVSHDLQDAVTGMFAGVSWLVGQPHTFWWDRPGGGRQDSPEDFTITGRTVYHGIPCLVLHRKGGGPLVRFYVGEKTGRLHGRAERALPGNPEADRQAVKAAAARGQKVKDFREFAAWAERQGRKEADRLLAGVREACHPSDQPERESWLLDYREVHPGRWFPMTQGWALSVGTHAKPRALWRSELKAAAVKVDTELPGALFALPAPKEGARAHDRKK